MADAAPAALRVLLLDDNPDDRTLAIRELRRHFPGCAVTEVAAPGGFAAALAAGLPADVVITDFQMQWTTGLDVLQAVKAAHPETPVIMFTATGTQEIAVEGMKQGLDDYVIKSPRHYVRLPLAVRACLDRRASRARALRSETRLATLLERIHVGVFRMALDGALLEANRAFRALLGLAPGAPLEGARHPLLEAIRGRLPALARTMATLDDELRTGGDGAPARFVAVRLVRVPADGHDAVDGLVQDETALREATSALHRLNTTLEARVAERTRELEEANVALETFGYSVSHDLREPLRTIQGYARALRQDTAAGRLEQLGAYADRIEAVARRVDQMVSELLEFARLSRAHLPTEPVALAPVVADARAALGGERSFALADVTVEVDPALAVRAHAATLRQVVTNLLSNAAKFTRPGRGARIGVTAAQAGARVRLTVADDGIGIAPEDQGRIWQPFERLHGEERYGGTGIGLAIVRAGVERMAGTAGVESEAGAGARFWVELPAA